MPVAALESLIPYPPAEEVSEEPVMEDSLAALEGFGGSHAVPVRPTTEEEPETDINNIDIAALGESLGLDPSNSRRRRMKEDCYPDYDDCYPEYDDCINGYRPERDYYYPKDRDCYSREREYDCSPRRREYSPECDCRGGRDYYGKP